MFALKMLPRLHEALVDFSWLLERGYATKSALELIGNRYQLTERQRLAVMRCACSDTALARRLHEITVDRLPQQILAIDGYNLLTTVEAALSGGIILPGRDGCYRDIASMHGTFRRVEETIPAIKMIGKALADAQPGETIWYFDSPVSNSGRLKGLLLEVAAELGWNWRVEIVLNPDPVLATTDLLVVSADSVILDQCERWCNLARWIVGKYVPEAVIVDFTGRQ